MAVYNYKGIKNNGKKVSGRVAAHSEREAERMVERLAVHDFTIKKGVNSLAGAEYLLYKDFGSKKLSKRNQAYFFEQLSFLMKSGLSQYECFDTMSKSTNIEIAKLAIRMKPSIASGLSLDEAMKKTGLFSYDTIAKITAGRSSGDVTKTLDLLAKKIKESLELRSKVISSLTYPCFMIFMLIAVLILMLVVIVPNIGKTIQQLGGEMPGLTVAVISASDFLVAYGLFILLCIVGVIGLHVYLLKNIKPYRFFMHTLTYKLPLLGRLVLKLHLQAFASTMSQLLSSGVTVDNALAICTKTTANAKMQSSIQKACVKITKEGYDPYSAIKSANFFPPDFEQMIMIGSKSANLTGVLESIADQYALEVQESLKRITALVEPLAILATALVGGVCVIAMYLPMFSVFQSI